MSTRTEKTLSKEKFPYYISKSIKKQLDKTKKIIQETNQDRVFLITGREGSGKSLLAMQFAYYIDNNFTVDDIAFNAKQFKQLIQHTTKGVVVFDEAFNGLSSKGALSKENKELVQLLIECRQRNLVVFIVLPSIFLVEKYVAIFRSNAVFNVGISQRDYKNRFYKVYNYNAKKLLYILGKPHMSYARPKINLMHRFYGKYPPTIDMKEYDKKKLEAFQQRKKDEVPIESRFMKQRDALVYILHKDHKISQRKLAKALETHKCDLSQSAISRIILKFPEMSTDERPNYSIL